MTLEGSKITKIRSMKKGEYYREGWEKNPHNPVYVIELDNNVRYIRRIDIKMPPR